MGPARRRRRLAAIVAILALLEFFDLGDRIGLRGFKKWTYFCTALIFYAQYSAGFLIKHSFSEGISIVRDAAGALLSIEAALLIFIFGCVTHRPRHPPPAARSLPAIAISSAAIFFVSLPFSYVVRLNEIERSAGNW